MRPRRDRGPGRRRRVVRTDERRATPKERGPCDALDTEGTLSPLKRKRGAGELIDSPAPDTRQSIVDKRLFENEYNAINLSFRLT